MVTFLLIYSHIVYILQKHTKMNANKENARKVAQAAVGLQAASDLILACGSAAAGYMITFQSISEHVQGWPLAIASILGGVLAFFLLDKGRKDIAPYAVSVILRITYSKSIKDRTTAAERMPIIFNLFAVVVFAVMLGASTMLNFVVTPDLAETVTGADDKQARVSAEFSGRTRQVTSVYEANLATYTQAVDDARASLQAVKAERDAAVAAAGPGYRTPELRNNAWAQGKLRDAQAAAARPFRRKIERAETALAKATEARAAFVASQGSQTQATITSMATTLAQDTEAINARFTGWLGIGKWIMAIAAIIFVFATAMQQIFEDVVGEPATEDADFAETVAGLFSRPFAAGINKLNGFVNKIGQKKSSTQVAYAGGGGAVFASPPPADRFADIRAVSASHMAAKAERQKVCGPAGCDTDRNRKTETERQKDRMGQTEQKTGRNADQTGGVGVEFPDPNNQGDVARFIRKWREWHNYEPTRVANRANYEAGAAWLEQNGYKVAERADGSFSIRKMIETIPPGTLNGEGNGGTWELAEVEPETHA